MQSIGPMSRSTAVFVGSCLISILPLNHRRREVAMGLEEPIVKIPCVNGIATLSSKVFGRAVRIQSAILASPTLSERL